MRERLSVTVITKNEEKRIAKCLESVAFADEILVVDSGSTDRTVEIARQHGARVIQQAWLGYGRQKQFAVDQAKNDWVLSLDADEWLTEELAASVRGVLMDPECYVYRIMRRNLFLGALLKHGEAYPDYVIRMYKKGAASWSSDAVHERVLTDQDVGLVDGELMHDSAQSYEHYLQKQRDYANIKSKRNSYHGIGYAIAAFLIRFFRAYILKLGCLDGVPGYKHAVASALSTYWAKKS